MISHNSYEYGRREYNRTHEDNGALVLVLLVVAALGVGFYLLVSRFHIRTHQIVELGFYVIALIFIIFDVEIAFIYPCAVVFRDWIEHNRGLAAFAEITLFIAVLLAGLAYAWAKGDLNWVKSISEDPKDDLESETRRIRSA